MLTQRPALVISILFITFLAIANLVRLFWTISIQIGFFYLPSWTGILFFLGFGTLAIWAWKELISDHSSTNSSHL